MGGGMTDCNPPRVPGLMNINRVVIKMQRHSKTDAGAARRALGTAWGRGEHNTRL